MQSGLSIGVVPKNQTVKSLEDIGSLEMTCPACCATIEEKKDYSNKEDLQNFLKNRRLAFNYEGWRKLEVEELDDLTSKAIENLFKSLEK